MHLKPTAQTRRVLAIIMMALLVFVQLVKSMHTHHNSGKLLQYHSSTAGGEHLQAAHDCAICDYQLVKDAALPANFSLPAVLSFSYIFFSPFTADQCSGEIPTLTSRGPPTA